MLVLAEQNRAFGYAVAASLALHALLLSFAMPAMREDVAPRPDPPLVAHLVEPAPPPAPPVVKEPRERPKPAPRKPPPRAKPQPAPMETVEEGVSQAELAPPPAPPPPVASLAPAAPAAPAATAAPAAAVAPATPDPAAALARFRQELVDIAKRNKRYPLMARDNGWTGDVVVRVEVAANGNVASVKVKTGSGFDVLDEQALETFRNAALQAAVPPALRGKGFSVDVLMQYRLD